MRHYFIEPGAVDQPHVWVAGRFLIDPPPGWMVEWNHAAYETGACDCEGPECKNPHGVECLVGTLVKSEDPQRVWKLTGTYNPDTDGYEAKWPD